MLMLNFWVGGDNIVCMRATYPTFFEKSKCQSWAVASVAYFNLALHQQICIYQY
jgi:hypothetical protein